jgi:hypothetical protein
MEATTRTDEPVDAEIVDEEKERALAELTASATGLFAALARLPEIDGDVRLVTARTTRYQVKEGDAREEGDRRFKIQVDGSLDPEALGVVQAIARRHGQAVFFDGGYIAIEITD